MPRPAAARGKSGALRGPLAGKTGRPLAAAGLVLVRRSSARNRLSAVASRPWPSARRPVAASRRCPCPAPCAVNRCDRRTDVFAGLLAGGAVPCSSETEPPSSAGCLRAGGSLAGLLVRLTAAGPAAAFAIAVVSLLEFESCGLLPGDWGLSGFWFMPSWASPGFCPPRSDRSADSGAPLLSWWSGRRSCRDLSVPARRRPCRPCSAGLLALGLLAAAAGAFLIALAGLGLSPPPDSPPPSCFSSSWVADLDRRPGNCRSCPWACLPASCRPAGSGFRNRRCRPASSSPASVPPWASWLSSPGPWPPGCCFVGLPRIAAWPFVLALLPPDCGFSDFELPPDDWSLLSFIAGRRVCFESGFAGPPAFWPSVGADRRF